MQEIVYMAVGMVIGAFYSTVVCTVGMQNIYKIFMSIMMKGKYEPK
jgi:large-conductance mechanosensitive channel